MTNNFEQGFIKNNTFGYIIELYSKMNPDLNLIKYIEDYRKHSIVKKYHQL